MGDPPTILVVDDEQSYRDALAVSLRREGFLVQVAADGVEALDRYETYRPALVLLDVMLPRMSGIDVCRELRARSRVPIIMLTARDAEIDTVVGLEVGADDYVTKPFAMDELLARMRAVARRARTDAAPPVLRFGELELDLGRELVTIGGEAIRLTPIEHKLLNALASNPGKLLTHRWLLQKVWGPGYGTESHYLRVFIRQLRQKLGDDPAKARYIVTEPGLGYRWRPEPTRD